VVARILFNCNIRQGNHLSEIVCIAIIVAFEIPIVAEEAKLEAGINQESGICPWLTKCHI
jgi:hypothetical protein